MKDMAILVENFEYIESDFSYKNEKKQSFVGKWIASLRSEWRGISTVTHDDGA